MESAQNTLRELFIKYDIPCSAGQRGSLEKYMELVLKKNKHVNLTSIDEPYEFLVKHFLDSAVLLKTAEYENAEKSNAIIGFGASDIVAVRNAAEFINQLSNHRGICLCFRITDYTLDCPNRERET